MRCYRVTEKIIDFHSIFNQMVNKNDLVVILKQYFALQILQFYVLHHVIIIMLKLISVTQL